MTAVMLLDSVATEINEILKGYNLNNKSKEQTTINVFTQCLPSKRNPKNDTLFPYVIIELDESKQENEEDNTVCTMFITAGVYDESINNQGWRDAFNLIEHIKQKLFFKRIIANRYEITYPCRFAVANDERFPYWYAAMEINILTLGLYQSEEGTNELL